MIKEKLNYGSFFFKLYIYYQLLIKEKYYINRNSYSQSAEDLFITKFFKNKKKGFYIDLGAFHPIRHNNTQKLYNLGWNGINIDLNPASIDFFNIVRKRDINIFAAIAPTKTKKKVYFDGFFSTTNTLNKKHHKKYNSSVNDKNYFFIKTKIFDEIINRPFDFLNIDIEGMDKNVLFTINLKKYSPKLVCIEILNKKTFNKISKYFKKNKYKFLNKLGVSYFFSR